MINEEERDLVSHCFEMDRRRTDIRLNKMEEAIQKIEMNVARIDTTITVGIKTLIGGFSVIVAIGGGFWKYQEKMDETHNRIMTEVKEQVHENTLKLEK